MPDDNAQVSSPGLRRGASVKRETAYNGPSAKAAKPRRKASGRRSTSGTSKRRPVERKTDKLCEYCQKPLGSEYRPTKRFCSDKCRNEARLDRYYHGGLRRTAVGFDDGTCWVCGKTKLKSRGKQVHHVMGKDNSPEPLVVLCRGCHSLVSDLGQRVFLADPEKVEDLITLARFAKGLPNVRTKVSYEEVE